MAAISSMTALKKTVLISYDRQQHHAMVLPWYFCSTPAMAMVFFVHAKCGRLKGRQ